MTLKVSRTASVPEIQRSGFPFQHCTTRAAQFITPRRLLLNFDGIRV
jgi:hypothetical protein